MKKLLLLVVGIIMLMSVNAMAQNVGAVMLYSEATFTNCFFDGNPAGIVTVYAVHRFHPGVTGSQFQVQDNGANFAYLAETGQNGTLVIGNAAAGASYAYGACVADPFNFSNILYSAAGAATVCASLEVVPSPSSLSGTIEGIDCTNQKQIADGSFLIVNGDGSCECGRKVPVEETNWGQIKALYGE